MKTLLQTIFSALLMQAFIMLSFTNSGYSQCTNSSQYPSTSFAINTSGNVVSISTCNFGGEYSVVTGALAGQTLQFVYDLPGGYVTVRSGSSSGPVVASGLSPLSFANGYTGTLYAHWNPSAACGTNLTCSNTSVQCTSCSVSAGCNNTSSFGSATINTSGTAVNISTCSFAGEYSTISGAVNGQTLQFTYSQSGGYITVRSGSSGGPVVAQGTSPLSFSNTFTGTLYAHWNTSSACGANTSCSTTTVQCTSCIIPITCPGDLGAGVVNIASLPYSATGLTTCGSGNNVTAANATVCGSSSYYGGEDKTFIFTPSMSGTYDISLTSGSSWVGLVLYVGCPFTGQGGTCLTQSQSSNGNHQLLVSLTAGTTYYLLVDSWPSPTCHPTFNLSIAPPIPPCNTPGVPLAASITTSSATLIWGTAMGATNYRYSSGTAGHVCGTGSLTTAGTSVNLSGLTPNTTYTFCVRTDACGGGAASGYVSTTFTTAPLPNDNCSGAATVTCSSTVNGSTVGASSDAAIGSCGIGTGGTPGNGVWYKLVGNGAQVTLNLCASAYDTKVHVYTGSCGSLTCLVSNDDNVAACGSGSTRSQVIFNANVGADYYILVSGFSTTTGVFSMNISCLCGPALGAPWTNTNIGSSNGGAIENVCDNTIDVSASNFGSPTNDVLSYSWQQMCGNGFIKAKVENVSNGGWGGIMFRENNAGGSKKVALRTQLTSTVVRDLRATTNGVANQQQFPRPNTPQWLRLTRTGNVFVGETSLDGVNWDFTFNVTLVLPSCIEVGLFAQSINVNTTATAVFSNIMGVLLSPPVVPLAGGNPITLNDVELDFSVYPNPAQSEINVKLGNEFIGKAVTIRVSNQLGQTVITHRIQEVQSQVERLPLNNLTGGLYILSLQTDGQELMSKKFVVGSERP